MMNNTEHSEQKTDDVVDANLVTQSKSKTSPILQFIKDNKALLGGAVLLTVGSLTLGFDVGRKQGMSKVGYEAGEQELAEIVEKQQKSLENITVALNTATQERDLAIDNAKKTTEELANAKQEQQLTESLSKTYQQKLRERGGLGLTVQNITVSPLPEDAYEYTLDLIQVSPNQRRASGYVKILLIRGEEVLAVPMDSHTFNFDSYQRLTGRWTMPSGFAPQFLEVQLSAGGTPVVQRYIWQRGTTTVNESRSINEIPQQTARAE